MKEKIQLIKKYLILFLIVVLNITCYASVVGDNDGSAFVTKAEFEVLKENFADQISDYNNSIDGKIDGAIANYLSGIKLSVPEEIKLPESILSWPITLYVGSPFDYNKHYGEGTYNYATGVAQWTPFFRFSNTINRQEHTAIFVASNAGSGNAWSTFYNYSTTQTINGVKYGIIDNVLDDYRAEYSAINWIMSYNMSGGGEGNFRSYLVGGITSAYTRTTGDERFSTGRTYGLVTSGTRFGTAGKTNGTALQFDYALTYTAASSPTQSLQNSSATNRKWTVSADGWQIATADYNKNPTWTIQYEIGKFNKLYNNTGYYVPVSYNNELYLTNYHTAFKNLYSGSVATIKIGDVGAGATGLTWTCTGYDSPNFTIADVDHCSKTNQFDTSFIKSDNLAYVNTDNDGSTVVVPMTVGQYLGKMQKSGKLNVTLNLNYTGTKVKVILRKKQITDTNINSDENILLEYGSLKNQKYAEIDNNSDTRLSMEVDKGDQIYIKVINGANQDIIFNKPSLTIIAE